MSARFEELDWRETPMGAISLRRRRDPARGDDVYEVKLDDDFLMSSLFTVAEIEVARLALAELSGEPVSTWLSVGSGSATPRRPCCRTRGSRSLRRGRGPRRGDRLARARADTGRCGLDR